MFKKTMLMCSLALPAGMAGAAPGDFSNPAHPGYVVSSSGGIVRSGFGACWHTRAWTPAKAIAPCDPVPVAEVPVKPVIAPKAIALSEPVAAPKSAPAPRIAKPEPEPKPAPVIHKVALDTELLFDFDSAELRPAGREKLDEIALKLHGADIESIEAVGHAGRIASDAYNQELSEERAGAVKAYLAGLGFEARRIRAEGRGELEPVTGSRCEGIGPENGDDRKLVACLQPDRRVELEVRGADAATP